MVRENFATAVGFTLRQEGGYVNDPDDPGGETNYGISKKYNPTVDIANLTAVDAAKIYKEKYWDDLNCDALPFPKDIVAFEMAVNPGKGVTLKALGSPLGVGTWEEMLFVRIQYYTEKVIENPKKLKYLFGWINRTIELRKLIKDEQKRRQ